ncbi:MULTISPECIES: substrate-binding periplasmic protein [unclassified Undibacterium]|uniref:substrate-binding periplasmic protein n=1 Tax=unclassified Undibacterium TaxID=2630295 RepID=UPI003C2C7B9D
MTIRSANNFTAYLTRLLLLLILLSGNAIVAARAETITLIGEDDWYPYSGAKNGRIRGFAADIIEAAYAASGIQVRFTPAPYSRCLMLAQTGQALGCFDSLQDAKLASLFIFHKEPIFKAVIGIYARADDPSTTVSRQELRGHKIGFTHGYTYGSEIENNAGIVRETAPSDLSNLRKLLRGRSDYSLVYTRVADHLSVTHPQEFKGKIKQVGVVLEDKLFVSFSKTWPGAARYAQLLDSGLLTIRANGTYARIEQRWQTPPP